MYLSSIKEEVEKFAKNPKTIAVCIVLCLAVACAGDWLLCRHYGRIERASGHDVTETVRDVKDLNRDAQGKLTKARDANQAAERANKNAQRAADSIADTNAELSSLNRSDATAVDAAEQIFRDVDAAGQGAKP